MTARAPEISLPKGGGAVSGLGETFQPDLCTGTGRFSIPLELPPGRNGLTPSLSLAYSSGHPNGPFGLGWSLPIASITRSTRKGIPRYDGDDVFVWDGGEDLLPVPRSDEGPQRYRPRVEGAFARIEHILKTGHNDTAQDYWQVRTADGHLHIYGTPRPDAPAAGWTDPAALRDPDNPDRIASWHLSSTTDACGNVIAYAYERDPDGNALGYDQLYLKEVRWCDYGPADDPKFLVRAVLDYEPRPDIATSRRLGFRVTTALRCTQITTHMQPDDTPIVARRVKLSYHETPGTRISLLARVDAAGHDGDAPPQQLPPLDLAYTAFDASARRFIPVSAPNDQSPPFSLAAPDAELVDVDGSGLPSLVQINGVARVWRNRGDGTFDRPRPLRSVASVGGLAAPGVQLADADGDGRPDLMLSGAVGGYFPLTEDGLDGDAFTRWKQAPPFALDAPDVRLLDLTGDGVSDALRLGSSAVLAYSDPVLGWKKPKRLGDDAPPLSFLDPRVKLADMTGDGLLDLTVVHDRRIDYWPYHGDGHWDQAPVTMHRSPSLPDGQRLDPQRLLLGDVDGNGLADALYVADGTVTLWLNQSGIAFSDPVMIRGTPPMAAGDSVRLVDFLGTGTAGVLWSSTTGTRHGPNYRFLDLTGAVKPYLLSGINNHTGARTAIEYTPSTRFMLADRTAGSPWRTSLPFPVQVVAKVTVDEAFTNSQLTTEYRYHHGHWDSAEREFRGFARVDQHDTSIVPEQAPPAAPVTAPRPVRLVQPPPKRPITHREANILTNADFSIGVDGPVTVTGAGANGDAAATAWTARNATTNPAASTTTQRIDTGLLVRTTTAGCGIAQAVRPTGEGPSRALVWVSVLVERGEIAIATGDGEHITLTATVGAAEHWQTTRTINARSPVSEIEITAVSPGGADFRLARVTAEPLISGNLLENADFATPSGTGPTTLVGPRTGGPSAAANWTTWNNSDVTTTTELVPQAGGGEAKLRVTTEGPGNGIVQTFLSEGTGPEHVRASALVKVISGSVSIGAGNGGSTDPDAIVQAVDGWQLLQGDERHSPANELIIYSASDAKTEFLVESAWVCPREAVGVEYSPPTHTRTWFHVGPVGPEHGAWAELDLADEHWNEDPALFARTADARSSPGLERRARRDAVRALRGRVLRRELYALDGSERAGRPVTVTEHQHAATAVTTPAAGVFFAHELAQRTTEWERGHDPRTHATFTDDWDDYGRSLKTINVAAPRGSQATGAVGEPLLATASRTSFATRDDQDAYMIDRSCGHATFEILDDGSRSLSGLRDAINAGTGPPSRLIGAQYTFFDGEPFVGLPWRELGAHGLVTRNERLVLTRGMLATVSSKDAAPAPDADQPPYLWPIRSPDAGVLVGNYYADTDLGQWVFSRPDPRIAVTRSSPDPALEPGPYSVRWRGRLLARHSERHTLTLAFKGGVRLWVNDEPLIDAWDPHPDTTRLSTDVDLTADEPVTLRLDYRRLTDGDSVDLRWKSPSQQAESIPSERLRPPADAAPTWREEYPDAFRALVPPMAGLTYHWPEPVGENRIYWDGYYATTARRYDIHDDPHGRGLMTVTRDELGHDTTVAYDPYALLPTAVTLPATVPGAPGLMTTADYDYRVLKPRTVTDPNGNRMRFAYEPLGLLAGSANLGKPDAREGDSDAQPAVTHTYDLLAADAGRAPSVHTTRRVQHRWSTVAAENDRRATNGLPPLTTDEEDALFPDGELHDLPERFVQTREFSDGLGRLLQTRTQSAPVRFGDPAALDDDSGLPDTHNGDPGTAIGRPATNERGIGVLVSGWTIRDNKGRVVHAYEPFFSNGFGLDPPEIARRRERVTTRYDALGRAVSVTAPDGSEVRTVHGVPGTIASPDLRFPDAFEPTPWMTVTYDANDNAARTHPLLSRDWLDHWNTPASQTVDALGRTIMSIRRGAAAEALTTTTRYDIRGNPLEVIDPLGRTAATTAYDLANRPWSSKLLDAGRVRHILDALGTTIETRDDKGALALAATDKLHRATHAWARDNADDTPTLRLRTFFGDAADPVGLSRSAATTANLLGRPYLVCDEAGAARNVAHDLDGNLVATGRQTLREEHLLAATGAYTVDWEPPAGTSFAEHLAGEVDATVYAITGEHDALGRRTRTVTPTAVDSARRVLDYGHDPAGRITSVAVDGDTFVERIAYDAHGRRILLARGNDVMTRYAYDARSFRLTRLRSERYRRDDTTYTPTGAPALQDLEHAYDLAGNVLSIADSATDPLVRSFRYDPYDRLLTASGRESGAPPSGPWDPRPRDLTQITTYSESFTYDGADNLLTQTHAQTGTTNGVRWVRRFDHAAGANRLTSVTTDNVTRDYGVDPCGNLATETSSRFFAWDWANRLQTFHTQAGQGPASVRAQYRYDAAGQRVHKLVHKSFGPGETCIAIGSLFERRGIAGTIPVANDEIHVNTGMETIARIRVGPAFDDDETPAVAYELTDHLGSNTVTTDAAGTFIRREEYSAYGETTFGSYARKRYRYTGKQRDDESGLAYHGQRYYAPWLARWTSVDPAGTVDGLNVYRYTTSNPVTLHDPTGTQSTPSSASSLYESLLADKNWHLIQQKDLRQAVTARGASSGIRPATRDAFQALADQWMFGKVDVGHPEPFAFIPPGKTVLAFPQDMAENRRIGRVIERPLVDLARRLGITVREGTRWPGPAPPGRGQPPINPLHAGLVRGQPSARPPTAPTVAVPAGPNPGPIKGSMAEQLEFDFGSPAAKNFVGTEGEAVAATAVKATSGFSAKSLGKIVPVLGLYLGWESLKADWQHRNYSNAVLDVVAGVGGAPGIAVQTLLSTGNAY